MSVTYTNGRLRTIISNLPKQGDQVAGMVAARLEAQIKQNIQSVGAVDTGALLNSPHTVKAGEGIRDVIVGAAHGIFVNYGTVHMPARPFFEPAILQVNGEIPAIAKGVLFQ